MQVLLNKSPGLRNDMLISIPRSEVLQAHLHIANRERLMRLPGLLRHLAHQDPEERRRVNECKLPVEEHIGMLNRRGLGLLDPEERTKRRLLVVGCRNLGNNHGCVAWQKDENPNFFHIKGDPLSFSEYACLAYGTDGALAIRRLRFQGEGVFEGEADISGDVDWCVYGNPVLRGGQIVPIEEDIDQYYDIRHVLAIDRNTPDGRRIEAEIFEGYPVRFRQNALNALIEKGVPRNRFLHNALGLSNGSVFILQREGTPEEIAFYLKEAGAEDGIILDNGGSVFCWVWWIYPKGGYLFNAPDFRTPSSAVIAFVLSGSAAIDLPGGSVSFTVV